MQLRDLLTGEARFEPASARLRLRASPPTAAASKPGFLFAAVPGTKADGLAYLPQAIAAGAVAVMAERAPRRCRTGCPRARSPNVRRALALAAARFYPRQPAIIAAVTGTSGKTSVAAFTPADLGVARPSAASIGTVGVVTPTAARSMAR